MSSRCPLLLAALLLLLGVACGRAPGAEHDPRPLRVVPARGVTQVAVAVRIEGENFQPFAVRQLSGGKPVRREDGFRAFLGDRALEDVAWVDAQTLRARVPAGLAPGRYTLTVESPLGRRVQLPQAYVVAAGAFGQLAASAQVERSALLVGQETQVSLELSNPGDAVARDVEVALQLEGPGSAQPLDASPVGELAPAARLTRSWRVQGTGPGALALRFRVTGTDAESGLALAPPLPATTLEVLTPAELVAQGALTLQQVSLGQELEALLTVHNVGGSAARAVQPELQSAGTGGVALLQAPPVGDVPGGALHTFRWRLRADAVGMLDLSAQASGTEALAGAALLTGPVRAGALRVQRPAALVGSLVTPGRVNVSQPFSVTLTVENTGEAAALGVRPDPLLVQGSAGAQQLSAPAAQDVPGGEQRTFTWSYQALAPGDLSFVAEARGADANSGATVSSGPVTDSLVEVQTPAALEATASAAPTQVSVGQQLLLELSVRNRGQADALGVQPSLAGFSSGPLSLVSAPSAGTVPGGGVHVFRWTFTAQRPGSVVLSASAQGTDANSGLAVDSGVASAAPVRVQAPATLQALLRAPEQVSEGQAFSVSLEVVHGGEAAVLGVTPSPPAVTGTGAAQLLASPQPSSVDLEAGARHTFTWRYTATRAGTLRFESGAAGTDANSGAPVTAPAPTPAVLSVQRPAALVATLQLEPETVNVGQLVTVSLTVENTGEATASAVAPRAPVLEGTGRASLTAGPSPASATLSGGAVQVFTWQYTATAAGTLSVSTAAAGADANSGEAVASDPVARPLTVQRPAQLTASLLGSPGQVDEGQELTLTLEVTNIGETTAAGVTAAAPLINGSSGTQLLASPEPSSVDLDAGERHLFTWRYRAGSSGGLSFSSSASGTDTNSGATVTTGQLSSPTLDVQQPPALVGSLRASPSTANEGQRIVLAFTVQNTGEATAEAVTPLEPLRSGTSDATLRAAPSPASVSLVGGASHTFLWEYDVGSAGSVLFTTRASGMGANTGAALQSADASAQVTVQLAAALVGTLTAPTRVSEGQPFTLTLQVQNTGQSAAQAVTPSAPTLSRAGGATLVSGPEPASAELAPGAVQLFTWRYTAGSSGSLTFGSSASGTDATSGSTLETGPVSAAPLTVQRPAALAATLSASPLTASVGQTLTVTLTVQNTGEALAAAVTPGPLTTSGTGSAALLSGPTPASTNIPGGASRSFSWQYTANTSGTLRFSATAAGRDDNSSAAIAAAPASSALLTLQQPPALEATLGTSPSVVNEAQLFSVTLTVQNTGEATATGVTPAAPTLSGTSTAALVSGPTPASATLGGGQSQAFAWTYRAGAAGDLGFASSAAGFDANSGAAVGSVQVASPSVVVLQPAQLAASLAVPAEVSVGQEFALVLTVRNTGDSTAVDVAPSGPTLGGTGGISRVSGPTPASASLSGGASQAFRWTYRADTVGSTSIQVGASGTDGTDGLNVTAAPASASTSVQRPAALSATLTSPSLVGLGETFTVTMTVRNDGAARALGVAPSPLQLTGNATAALVSGPLPSSATLPGGETQAYTWRYTVTSEGSLAFAGHATGTDANSGAALASPVVSTSSSFVRRAVEVANDPFGDGTRFAWVYGRDGKVHLGPNKSGSGGVRSNPDGSAPQSFAFRFAKDVTGFNTSDNASPAPYPSIGSKGCLADTPACGPNNEAGRGLFFHGSAAGQDWLGVAGAHPTEKVNYLYLTPENDDALDFRYMDLNGQLNGSSLGFTAARFYGSILYVGTAATGGARPGLLALSRMPSLPGLDGNDADEADLDLSAFPYFGNKGNPANPAPVIMIDAMAEFRGNLYLANNGGCARTTVPSPRPYKDFPADWANCRPNAPEYNALTSVTISQAGELEPSDRAVPQLVPFGGRLYMARNTTVGPQLFACMPGATGFPADCDPGDWALVAPNGSGDPRLTQFDMPGNTHVTLLAATNSHLYVGFNNASDGLVVFRTSNPSARLRSDFRGTLDCPADQAASTCKGLGENGLGVGATRIFDGTALTFEDKSYLYLTVGTGTDPLRVFRIAD